MELVNLTPHVLNIHTGTDLIVLEPSGRVARVRMDDEEIGEVDGIPVMKAVFGEVRGLPDPEPGVAYVVSRMVLSALQGQGRDDVFAPGRLLCDENGRISGCMGLSACAS